MQDDELQTLVANMVHLPAYDAAYQLALKLGLKYAMKPVVNVVRPLLGRGSNSTIQAACGDAFTEMCQRARQQPEMAAPAEVKAAYLSLWRAAVQEASQAFAQRDAASQQQLAALEQRGETALQHAREYEAAVRNGQGEIARLLARIDTLSASNEQHIEAERCARDRERLALLQAEASRSEMVRVREAAEDQVRQLQDQYHGLRTHLLAETARERNALKAQSEQAMRLIADERAEMKVRLQNAELQSASLRRQANECRAESQQALASQHFLARENDGMKVDIARLNDQIERLLRMLEETNRPRDSTPLAGADTGALRDIVWASYRALLADQECVPPDELRAEVLERWRDLHGVGADCAIELADILNDPELRVKMRLDDA